MADDSPTSGLFEERVYGFVAMASSGMVGMVEVNDLLGMGGCEWHYRKVDFAGTPGGEELAPSTWRGIRKESQADARLRRTVRNPRPRMPATPSITVTEGSGTAAAFGPRTRLPFDCGVSAWPGKPVFGFAGMACNVPWEA